MKKLWKLWKIIIWALVGGFEYILYFYNMKEVKGNEMRIHKEILEVITTLGIVMMSVYFLSIFFIINHKDLLISNKGVVPRVGLISSFLASALINFLAFHFTITKIVA